MPVDIPLLVISALEMMMYAQTLKGLEQYKAEQCKAKGKTQQGHKTH